MRPLGWPALGSSSSSVRVSFLPLPCGKQLLQHQTSQGQGHRAKSVSPVVLKTKSIGEKNVVEKFLKSHFKH